MSWWHDKDMINDVGGVAKAKEKQELSILASRMIPRGCNIRELQ